MWRTHFVVPHDELLEAHRQPYAVLTRTMDPMHLLLLAGSAAAVAAARAGRS